MATKDAKAKHAKPHRNAKPAKDAPALPQTRAELLPLHEAARQRRNAAKLGGATWTEASLEVERIEVEIARLERAMDPPAV